MKWMLIAVQAFVVMFCLAYGSDVRAEITEKVPEVTILLERMYVDGEVSEEILTEKVADLEKFLAKNIKNGNLLIVMMCKSYYKGKLMIFLLY